MTGRKFSSNNIQFKYAFGLVLTQHMCQHFAAVYINDGEQQSISSMVENMDILDIHAQVLQGRSCGKNIIELSPYPTDVIHKNKIK